MCRVAFTFTRFTPVIFKLFSYCLPTQLSRRVCPLLLPDLYYSDISALMYWLALKASAQWEDRSGDFLQECLQSVMLFWTRVFVCITNGFYHRSASTGLLKLILLRWPPPFQGSFSARRKTGCNLSGCLMVQTGSTGPWQGDGDTTSTRQITWHASSMVTEFIQWAVPVPSRSPQTEKPISLQCLGVRSQVWYVWRERPEKESLLMGVRCH